MKENKQTYTLLTAAAAALCILLCGLNIVLMVKSSWDFYPQLGFLINIITVDYSIFIVPVIFLLSLLIKNKLRFVIMALCIIWLLLAGSVMNIAVASEKRWERQKPEMPGEVITDTQANNIYSTDKNVIIYLTTVKESGRVELESYFAYWDDISAETRGDKSTYYYFGDVNEDRNYYYQTNNLIKAFDIKELPAAVVINSDGTKTVYNGLEPVKPLTKQENESAKALVEYLNKQ